MANERRATVDTSIPGTFQYVVSIEDPITPGCFVNDTTTVNINAIPLGAALNTVNPACGASNGAFDFDITTTGLYSYSVRGNSSGVVDQSNNFVGPGTINVTGLAADVYSIEISDVSSGCLNTVSDIQVQSDPPDFTITSTTPADATDCGVNDGNICWA